MSAHVEILNVHSWPPSSEESLSESESLQLSGGSYIQQTSTKSVVEVSKLAINRMAMNFQAVLLELFFPMFSLSTTSSVHLTAFFFVLDFKVTVAVVGSGVVVTTELPVLVVEAVYALMVKNYATT